MTTKSPRAREPARRRVGRRLPSPLDVGKRVARPWGARRARPARVVSADAPRRHVIYGVRDLDAAARHLYRKHGLASAVGGRHPAWGTENRIVPLNDAYLELTTVFDPALAAKTPLGRFVAQRIARGDGFLGWMAAGEGFEDRARRSSSSPSPSAASAPTAARCAGGSPGWKR